MKRYALALKAFFKDRRGVTALEYGMIGSIIFAAIFAGFLSMSNTLSNKFMNIGSSM